MSVDDPPSVAASTAAADLADVDDVWRAAAAVPDPEMPPLTIADLGILRSVDHRDGMVVVTITPTYSGCPAVDMIESGVVDAVVAHGVNRDHVRVERVLAPAWTTDWITDDGLRKLAEAGISPPRPLQAGSASTSDTSGQVAVAITAGSGKALVQQPVGEISCPQCGSLQVTELSRFSSTACKALYRCDSCLEPFDHVKEL